MNRFYVVVFICVFAVTAGFAQNTFKAIGPEEPEVEYLEKPYSKFPVPRELRRVAVEVFFDLTPTIMRFSMPCYPCMVTENGIHFSNGWTETYDPRASSSCEVLWDKEARYARMWIESRNPARIIVRVRAALADPDGRIAHNDIPSGSPYGKGDWTDEWYTIYPDGTHTRYVRIYTGLAEQSVTVTDQLFDGRVPIAEIPPRVVHEFQEDFIFGLTGHWPGDDIETAPKTLIMLDGSQKTISYKPYPKDFGEFAAAPIKVINTRSRYKPFTISIPCGIENEPYPPEGDLPYGFQTWLKHRTKGGYSVSLGHTLNWWHYRRTDKLLEQVYVSGMTDSKDPAKTLLPLAQSWLRPPRLVMEGLEPAYRTMIYDPAQLAYILPMENRGPRRLEFALDEYSHEEGSNFPVWIVNPVFVLKDWGKSSLSLRVNGKTVQPGKDFRIGYERTHTGTDCVLWLKMESRKKVNFEILPKQRQGKGD